MNDTALFIVETTEVLWNWKWKYPHVQVLVEKGFPVDTAQYLPRYKLTALLMK